MCWSGEASAVVAATGIASTVYFYHKGESKPLCAALFYFSLMELLQAYTYTVIDQCYNPANTFATYLGYTHIAFQPIFFNLVSLHFIPPEVRSRIIKPVLGLSFVASIAFLIRILPFDWSLFCYEVYYSVPFFEDMPFSLPFCGKETCSISGDWHIAWQTPAPANAWLNNSYFFAAFVLPILYGSWRVTIYHILTGPLLAGLTTSNTNEWAAVWCLYSIGLLLLLIKTPIRQYIHTTTYYGFNYPSFLKHKTPATG